ncbi:efflux RND transporter periplasmic adaptor subunit [Mesorhizobium sp. BR1-1-9]|uniref:efflux RND transporter periplasmic adaptor subunit n=1 Tax=Mesorhizobium sp. BR1-1-9 TaxID=2876646 RepID=UPI001CD087CA|nr:efflux RND transporter periplasmic adaptor subunit [Mesorhizobium sp. BR1-1-9]MBZ9872322.1 efflux RND transporter periplasmic adaptor subunit [Mesorhizobium sp. BR1-1-9]
MTVEARRSAVARGLDRMFGSHAALSFLSIALFAAGTGLALSQTADGTGIRAQLVSRSTTMLSSEVAGKVVALPFREGEAFREGEQIAAIDCATYQAKLALADAQVRRSGRKVDALKVLDKKGATGKVDVDLAEIDLLGAKAEYSAAATDVSRCNIMAPFSGRIAELKVHQYQYVSAGEPMLDIISDHDLEVELLAPSRWLTWLKPGATFALRIDELNRAFPAIVARTGARIDPVSQSIKVYARIDGKYPELIPGMSGLALVAPPEGGTSSIP